MKKFLKFMPILAISLLVACSSKNPTNVETSVSDTQIASEESSKSEENIAKESEASEKSDDKISAKINDIIEDKKVYVDVDWVKNFIDNTDKSKFILAEVTWGDEKASPDFLKKHIKGAIHINTDDIEEGPIWNLKPAKELEKNFLKYGITADKTLILYGPNIGADRMAFAALYLGVKDVKIIDGRLNAWEKASYPLESGSVKPIPETDFKASVPAHPEYILSLDETIKKLKEDDKFTLVSLRSKEEWLGQTSGYSYIPKAGEPKGSFWGESGQGNSGMEYYLNEDLTVKPMEDIVKHWNKHGFTISDDMSFYCGTGWRAATPWLMMYERGYKATMFDGGWNEWQMHDDLDVQIGDPADKNFVKVGDLPNDKALQTK